MAVTQYARDQRDFFVAFCRWGLAVQVRGYECSVGDAYRDPRAKFPYALGGGMHPQRRAVDVNLFKAGESEPIRDVEGWREAGELWETLGGTWGGRWKNGDANHLSWKEGK